MFEPCEILGIRIHRITKSALSERLDEFVQSDRPHQIVTVNTDFLRLARDDAAFRETINAADLVVPDGVPVVWLARLLGEDLLERVTGPDILELAATLAATRGYRIFLLGAEPGVAHAAGRELERRHPGLRIAAAFSPPLRPLTAMEDADIVRRVRDVKPHMLFVALGAPRQELWIARHMAELSVPVSIGVGGTFDFLAGLIPRAPDWLQHLGLEWSYRLKQEPSRLWRRYLLGDLPFFLRALASTLLPPAKDSG
jgi:N-acetylglucosaminyldiphosphoundecaprenol N-acetyl-beta-D-mannosaminyltransferase